MKHQYAVRFYDEKGEYIYRTLAFCNPVDIGGRVFDDAGVLEGRVFGITHHPSLSTIYARRKKLGLAVKVGSVPAIVCQKCYKNEAAVQNDDGKYLCHDCREEEDK